MSSSSGFHDPFHEHHKFQDDIWGRILLSDMERDVIDTPEFQRLFRTSQLGFVDLVYQTANHTRGAHSIGACHVATLLLDSLKENRESTRSEHQAGIQITAAERVLIRLGALLHDVSHVPLSHDIERKKHHIEFGGGKIKMPSHYGQYDKHDDFVRNPLLFVLLFDTDTSVLARLLRSYSKPFYTLLKSSDGHAHAAPAAAGAANGASPQERKTHLSSFVSLLRGCEGTDWDPNVLLLPNLLFHLLTVESPEEDGMHRSFDVLTSFDAEPTLWGLGPPSLWNEFHNAWYQPFRHDIIGNTLSADLIDYLRRDPQRLGMDRRIELYILNYYILVHDEKLTATFRSPGVQADKKLYRCAIDVIDDKRGTSRTVLLNDLFRLLDLRHEIHEKAVMHRVVQGAIAMLSRTLLILTDKNAKPSLPDILALKGGHHALQGEESFFHFLLATCREQPDRLDAYAILSKLVDRRIYRPLMIIPGDRAAKRFTIQGAKSKTRLTESEFSLRTLAALVDSTYYSRFLLFVSALMEKLLQGGFEGDNDMCQYVTDHVVKSDSDLDEFMKLIPSRVIAWTTPFKQLYKDPAIMVALKDGIIRLDELAKDGGQSETDCTTIRSLVTASIEQADVKYSAMWKLYVFVSDSLFYTGILSKLTVPALPTLQARRRQNELLENAQTFFIRAFDVMFANWAKRLEDGLSPDDGDAVLKSAMDSGAFRTLVGRWISLYQSNNRENAELARESWDPSFELSTVNLDRYVHGWDPEAGRPEANCRDIQYKADKTNEEQLRIARKNPASAQGRLMRLLEQCSVTTVDELSEKEFICLLRLFEKNEEKCTSLRESGAGTNDLLRALWADELPGLFRPTRDAVRDDSTRRTAPSPQFDLRDRESIKKWFVEEMRVCEAPHVRRALLASTDAFVDLIESAGEPKRNDLASAIRRRVINEVGFIFNRLKEDQIERWLDSQRRLLAGEATDGE
ncbi:MAG: HD domain-containing protein [Gemmataceae bacterium]